MKIKNKKKGRRRRVEGEEEKIDTGGNLAYNLNSEKN